MTLYETLGVDRGATAADLKRAYRAAAKKAHPDTGGDEQRFNALTKAYNILRDNDRRRRYDATGDTTEATPDNSQAEILMTIALHLERVVASAGINPEPMERTNLIEVLTRSLNETKTDIKKQQNNARDVQALWKRLEKRFKSKKQGVPSALDAIVGGKVAQCVQAVAEGDRKAAVVDKAIELVKSETFTVDPTTARPLSIIDRLSYPSQMFGRYG